MPAAFDDPVGNDVETDPVRMGAADVIPEIHPEFPLPFPLESIALAARPGKGRQFRLDSLGLDAVIPRIGHFVLLGERNRLPERGKEEIPEVHAAGTT